MPQRREPFVTVKLQDMAKTKKGGKSPLGERIALETKRLRFDKPDDFAHKHGIAIRTFHDLMYGETKTFPDSLINVAQKLGLEPWDLRPLVPLASQKEIDHNKEKGTSEKGPGSRLQNADTKVGDDVKAGHKKNHSWPDAIDNPHTIISEIVSQILTALEPKLLPANISKDKRDLINEIISRDDAFARGLLTTLLRDGLDKNDASAWRRGRKR